MEFEVGKLADLGEEKMLSVMAGEQRVVLFLSPEDGSVTALEDKCSHANVRLSRGTYDGKAVQCPAHGARFDVCSGKALCMPAVAPVKNFPVRVEGDSIFVTVG